jgi:hypothetical protein
LDKLNEKSAETISVNNLKIKGDISYGKMKIFDPAMFVPREVRCKNLRRSPSIRKIPSKLAFLIQKFLFRNFC